MPRSPMEIPLEKLPFAGAFLSPQIPAFCPLLGEADLRGASALSLS